MKTKDNEIDDNEIDDWIMVRSCHFEIKIIGSREIHPNRQCINMGTSGISSDIPEFLKREIIGVIEYSKSIKKYRYKLKTIESDNPLTYMESYCQKQIEELINNQTI